ncbi:hypothetical protein [Bacillus pumilus]|nr:hypothetical protein [Bacillus pumilus]
MAVFILFVVFGFPILSVLIGIFGTMLLDADFDCPVSQCHSHVHIHWRE